MRNKFSPNEKDKAHVSAIFYLAADYAGWIKGVKNDAAYNFVLVGETKDVGEFLIKLKLADKSTHMDIIHANLTVATLKEELIQNGFFATKSDQNKKYLGLQQDKSVALENSNLIAFQVTGSIPFEFEVIFESKSLREESRKEVAELSGAEFDTVLADYYDKFVDRFETTFDLKSKNFSASALKMAQAAFSNLIGGIGFFSGQALVSSHKNNEEPVLYWHAKLYTAVPARSTFPRGFLWDEGYTDTFSS